MKSQIFLALGLGVLLIGCNSSPTGPNYGNTTVTSAKLLDHAGTYQSNAALKDSVGVITVSALQPPTTSPITMQFYKADSTNTQYVTVNDQTGASICIGTWTLSDSSLTLAWKTQINPSYCPAQTGPVTIRIAAKAMAIQAQALVVDQGWIVFSRPN